MQVIRDNEVYKLAHKRNVAVGDSGVEVFMKVDDGAGGVDSMFSMLYDFMTDLEANTPSATTLTRLDSALDTVLNTRAIYRGTVKYSRKSEKCKMIVFQLCYRKIVLS